MKKQIRKGIESAYARIHNEEDARVCKEIPEDACKYSPVNFFLLIISGTFTRLGDALSNPKTVLTWLMGYVNAPLYLISFLVPIRESGSMLPQIFIASYIRRRSLRKWVWVTGALLQFTAIASIGVIALFFREATAGWLMILALVIFSLARGLSSVASKDVIGKTIPKTRRGRLNGFSTSISGVLTLLSGLFLLYRSGESRGVEFYAWIIFFASSCWVAGAVIYSGVKEFPGETSGGGNAWREAIARLDLLRKDKPFRNFVIARSLLLCSALTAPFYVVLSQDYAGKELQNLGLFIIANGLASGISAPVWGRMADRSSKKVMIWGALITSLLGIIMFTIISRGPGLREAAWLYPVAFFILGTAHSGVRIGRKTYIIDMAGGNKRTDYVAVSNTVIGLVLLITGGIRALASFISVAWVIAGLSLLGLAGAYASARLPSVE